MIVIRHCLGNSNKTICMFGTVFSLCVYMCTSLYRYRCTCTCVYVYVCVYMYMCTCVWNLDVNSECLPYFLRKGLPLTMELANSARLVSSLMLGL